MAAKRKGWAVRRRRAAQRKAAVGVLAAVVLLGLLRPMLLLYLGVLLVCAVSGWMVWRLRRTDRLLRSEDAAWRRQEEIAAGRRTLAAIDVMSGTEFEEVVAELCRRDGCTQVRRVGGAGDNGADVLGRLPDGRTMVIQCKRYAPHRTIASREVRDLLGAKVHFTADVAVFVATTRFSPQAEAFAVKHHIITLHRDFFGLWNNGTLLLSLAELNGHGQGEARHRARWKRTYSK
ncbi:restriction endonuclease [Streptomyces justiciae]|uniref:restriction endonuclease n=1 Tax=Streptomyces justiciae TaxID=2780140 RepID=UPI001881DE86|nr:restriction endonuclease [Streptomyces justiciae]MBE8475589.1 restriction endonuclease [Streptomyces justiciae]MCW8382509.1 restriction endonuclease [Streptomyces justiciae]